MDTARPRKKLIQSIERALNILEVVREGAPIRTTDIARAVGLSPSAANNIVRTLFIRNYLAQDDDGRYLLGYQAYLMGTAADAWTRLRQAAAAPMLRLNQATGFLCFLGVELQGRVIAVHIVEGSGAVVVPRNQKWLDQLHCTAAGKVLLASMPPERYATLRKDYQLVAHTPRTSTRWQDIDRDIESIRATGFYVCKDESVYGVSSVSVPVTEPDGAPAAALSVSFSSYFLTPKLQADLLAKLRAAAQEITVGLG